MLATATGAAETWGAITADIPGLLASAVDFPAEGETETAALASGNNITDIIGKVLGNIAFSAGNGNIAKLDINPGGLLTALALDEGNTNTIGAIFGDPDNESALGGVSLAITSVGVFDTDFGDFDMINTLTKVKDASVEVRNAAKHESPFTKEELKAFRRQGKTRQEIAALEEAKRAELAEAARLAEEEAKKNAPKTQEQLLQEIVDLLGNKQ